MMMDLFDLVEAIADECYKDYNKANKQKTEKETMKVPTIPGLRPTERACRHFSNSNRPVKFSIGNEPVRGSKKRDTIKKDIKDVIFNDKKKETTIFWQNGDATRVTCQEDDEYNRYVGFYAAVCKHALGNKGYFNDIAEYWVEKREKEVAERKVAKEKAKAEAKKSKLSTDDIMIKLNNICKRLDAIENASKGVDCERS